MKINTIKLVCSNKHRHWVESITDEAVRKLVQKNAILTGGAIVSMLMGEAVNDFDFYLRDQESVASVAAYYAIKFVESHPDYAGRILVEQSKNRVRLKITSAGGSRKGEGNVGEEIRKDEERVEAAPSDQFDPNMEDGHAEGLSDDERSDPSSESNEKEKDEKQSYVPLFITENAITLSGGVQIVLRFFGEPEEIHKNYDFVHCTNYWTSNDNKLTLRAEALESIITKELRYVGSKYPLCSMIRIRKFIRRGFTISAGQILKIIFQCHALDLRDVAVLRDQLTGVDTAYFMQFLEAIDKATKTHGNQLDTEYLVALVEKILR